jgi:hypothetical protein
MAVESPFGVLSVAGFGKETQADGDLERMLAKIVGIERAGFRGLTIKTRKFYLPSHR